MRYEWDEAKSEENLRRRGFDFAQAMRVFEVPTTSDIDARHDYGERRERVTGYVDGRALRVVFTDRVGGDGEVVRRIISARYASRDERARHEEEMAGR